MQLIDYRTNETLRTATLAEFAESVEAARHDGGAGVIEVDGLACYVNGTADDLADELRVAAYDDAETFGREGC